MGGGYDFAGGEEEVYMAGVDLSGERGRVLPEGVRGWPSRAFRCWRWVVDNVMGVIEVVVVDH